jgi:hypothetical protein
VTFYDPGADLADRYHEWVWRRRDLRGIPEVLSRAKRVIITDRRLSRVESRCTLAHAVAHLDLEHAAIFDGRSEKREELAADRLAARRLLPFAILLDALAEGRDTAATADLLHVTPAVLTFRLDHLHPSERGALHRRHSMKEHTA